jgi:cytochrome subunit of sulfide dehydrogenase
MRLRLLLPALASVFLLAGPAWAADAPPGASSCTGCHAAKRIPDSVIPRIAGRKASDIVQFMREYRSGAWPSSVMGRIAKGFDDQQIDAIAAWFAAQPE